VLLAALGGGMLARRLKLPVILGYLAGGLLVGPFGLKLVHDVASVDVLATIGVILLLFTLGLEFSLSELKRLGRVAILGGLIQIVLTALIGLGLGKAFGWQTTQAIFFGFLIALSSTMIVLKTLLERGELDTTHGRVLIGILLIQDLSLVPLMIILPTLGGENSIMWATLGLAALKAALFIGLMLALGFWVLPWFLGRVAGAQSRELFLLTVVTLSLAAAFSALWLGISAAIGAFIVGLLIGQSVFARQAFADIVPLRDIFGALFFVSLGMLADINFVAENPGTVLLVVAVILVGKFVTGAAVPLIFGFNTRTAFFTGMGLLQIGEFSFVLAGVGLEEGVISQSIYSVTLAAAVITMALTPFAISLAPPFFRRLEKSRLGKALTARPSSDWPSPKWRLTGHAVICGHGRVGSTLSSILERRNLSYLVIDIDPNVIARLRATGVPCIYGDASNPEILARASLEKARILVSTVGGSMDIELTVRNARHINPGLDIIARVHRDRDAELLKGIGVSELVRPEFEAGLEITRHTLHRFGLTAVEIQRILSGLRQGRPG